MLTFQVGRPFKDCKVPEKNKTGVHFDRLCLNFANSLKPDVLSHFKIFGYMNKLIAFLFPARTYDCGASWTLLALRVVFGGLLMSHGWAKLMAFGTLSQGFPDPLGVGPQASLCLAIFGELLCGASFVLGFLHRLCLLPMIFTMGVAICVIHSGQPFEARELAFAYFMVFIITYVAGPGRYSVDSLLRRRLVR